MAANTQIIATTRRLRNASSTKRSITEQHSALDDDPLAGRNAAPEHDLVALLEADVDGARLERPWRGLDIDEVALVLEHERAGRHHGGAARRRMERDVGEHAGPQPRLWVPERDAHLAAPRVGI